MNDVGEMRKKYTGKTMLFLDGSHLGALAIQRAKEWGIRTVVANYYPQKENPGKQICDVAVDIDYNNIPEMLKLIEREHIDGIMAGWTDSILPVYARICERAGMPSYGTEEQFDLFTQKHKYKRLLEQYDIPVVDEYQLDDRFDPQELVRIEYPVLTKPSDGSGSRGIKVCRNEAELKEGYRYAKEHSVSGDVIIEKYMQGDEIVALWYVQDGEAHLTALGNWHKKQYYDGLNAMGIGYTFPSSYLNIYEKTIAPKIKRMLSDAGIKDGPVFFQCFLDGGVAKVYDIGYRLTGTLEFMMTDAITGINAMECMIEYALSGTVSTDVRSLIDPHFNGEYGWVVDFIARPGIISEIRGLDEISRMKNVVGVAYNHSPGDKIRDDQKGQLSQIVLRVIGKSGRLSEINSDMQEVYRKLSVRSDTDTEMLLPFDDIRQYYGIIEKSRGGIEDASTGDYHNLFCSNDSDR